MSKTYLYILRSEKNPRLYVGVTYSIERRLERHNSGKVVSTKKDVPYRLVYSEEFVDLISARKREKFLKTTQGKRVIQNRLLHL